jgi:hypothetical protein
MIANNPKLKNITAITNRAGASERLGTALYIATKATTKGGGQPPSRQASVPRVGLPNRMVCKIDAKYQIESQKSVLHTIPSN